MKKILNAQVPLSFLFFQFLVFDFYFKVYENSLGKINLSETNCFKCLFVLQ